MEKVINNVLRGFRSIGGVYPLGKRLPKISSNTLSSEDAMREDWSRVGGDISVAMHKFEREHGATETGK